MMRIAFWASTAVCLAGAATAQITPKGVPMDECLVIRAPVAFCGSMAEFTALDVTPEMGVDALFVTDSGIQALTIIEDLEPGEEYSITDLQATALSTLAEAAGESIENIPIIERSTQLVSGVAHPNFVYRGTVDGVSYVYSNTIVLLGQTLTQFITIDPDTMIMTPAHRNLHARFLAQTEVAP